jgi:hypothetical protein
MVSQDLMIGIVVGIFFVGLGIGYVTFQGTSPATPMMNSQEIRQTIRDPQLMNQWHEQMAQDPQFRNQWMNSMMQDQQFMNHWIDTMVSEPEIMQQITSKMAQNQGFIKNLMEEQAQRVVSDAVALYDVRGVEAFEIINSKSANLKDGELYPFVLDPIEIIVVAHGFEPTRVGTKSVSLTESDRTYEEILEDLKKNMGTWVEYRYTNPDTQEEQIKKTWLYLHDGYIFACGYYM